MAMIFPAPLFAPAPLFQSLLTGAVNRLLHQEAWARDLLAEHAGKTLHIAYGKKHLGLTISAFGLVQIESAQAIPNVTVRLAEQSPVQLLQALSSSKPQALHSQLHIEGEAALAQVLSELAQNLRPDLEDALARRLGDIPTVFLLEALQKTRRILPAAFQNLGNNLSEYLVYESGLMLSQPAFKQFDHELLEMEQRLNALENRLSSVPHFKAIGSAGSFHV